MHPVTAQFIKEILTRPEREVEFLGETFLMRPGVFPIDTPFSHSSVVTVKRMPVRPGDSVLDIGTGTGVQGIFAAKKGALRVLAVDIDKPSLELAKNNVHRHGLEGVMEVRESDLFSAIGDESFDVIISQLPFADGTGDSPVDHFLFDEGYVLHERLLKEAAKWLRPEGRVIIPSGDIANEDRLLELMKLYGWRLETEHSEEISGVNWKALILTKQAF